MTTKKKSAPKTGEKSKKTTTTTKTRAPKALTEPTATATSATLKADKREVTAPVAAPAVAPVIAPVQAAEIEVSVSTEKPVLTIGMFQKRLHEQGYYQGWWDGHYGPLTKQAVASFQAAHGLHPDGEPTPATLQALGF